jgi:purine-binding chemotaxis protein CheW
MGAETNRNTDADASKKQDLVQMLVFRLGDEEYVIDIMRVNEIIRPEKVTAVRKAPEYIKGVIELRGTIVPIVDLRKRLGLESRSANDETYIVIVTVEGVVVGVEVDVVVEVVRIDRGQIKASPDLTREENEAPFFLGICKQGERLLMLLNIKRLVLTRDAVTVEPWLERARIQKAKDE